MNGALLKIEVDPNCHSRVYSGENTGSLRIEFSRIHMSVPE